MKLWWNAKEFFYVGHEKVMEYVINNPFIFLQSRIEKPQAKKKENRILMNFSVL